MTINPSDFDEDPQEHDDHDHTIRQMRMWTDMINRWSKSMHPITNKLNSDFPPTIHYMVTHNDTKWRDNVKAEVVVVWSSMADFYKKLTLAHLHLM